MASWLEHPTYIQTRERLIKDLCTGSYRFRKLAPVLFLCGGMDSSHRDTVRKYLAKKYGVALQMFYAEAVWDSISKRTGRSALQMEAELAALADLLIIIVESPGTFAELGAFSLSSELRYKLLPLVDITYRGQQSFISTGPLRWIDAESKFGPTVYVPLQRILEIVDELEDRIARIEKARPKRLEDLAQSPKHLLFFITDLVAVIYPATLELIQYYLTRIAPSIVDSAIDVPTLVGLAVAMGLLKQKEVTVGRDNVTVFMPTSAAALDRPYHHRRLLDLPSRRADHIAALMTIPITKTILESLQSPKC